MATLPAINDATQDKNQAIGIAIAIGKATTLAAIIKPMKLKIQDANQMTGRIRVFIVRAHSLMGYSLAYSQPYLLSQMSR